ncbi:hypothetical protein JCGZ_09894 [Jatropha curcas]|uniref:Uncharacterized protein n=1 Tax=Jatropha curcas TaxID=180498 RepID=A0A067KIH6_JATCU|nr:uncharacterized protein LOC105635999 [Jatropha curcas]KDP35922.1 hypothetical protein JCGZ_09894 [Jatropha curcas]
MKRSAGNALVLAEEARKAARRAKLAALAAVEAAVKATYSNIRRRRTHPPHALHSSVVNSQLKSRTTPLASSTFGKFFGLVDPPCTERSKIISQFTKMHVRLNPGMRKDRLFEHKIMHMVSSGKRIGLEELTKFLSK